MGILNIVNFQFQIIPDPNKPGQSAVTVQSGAHGLFSGGVIIDLAIGVDGVTLQSLHQGIGAPPLPSPVVVKALLDTGCTVTSIDQKIAAALNLAVRGYSQTSTANGIVTVPSHTVSLAFPGTPLRGKPIHPVQAIDLSGHQIQALIGRDIMLQWSIHYNGPAGMITISD